MSFEKDTEDYQKSQNSTSTISSTAEERIKGPKHCKKGMYVTE